MIETKRKHNRKKVVAKVLSDEIIELVFKIMKQNFQLHYFYGENETAIRTQVWCTLNAFLLLTILQKQAKVEKAFSIVATLVNQLFFMLDAAHDTCTKMERRYLLPLVVAVLLYLPAHATFDTKTAHYHYPVHFL